MIILEYQVLEKIDCNPSLDVCHLMLAHHQKKKRFHKHLILNRLTLSNTDIICGVIVSVLSLSVVDRRLKPKTTKLVFPASPLSTEH